MTPRSLAPFAWTLASLLALVALAVNQSAVHWRENIADSDLFSYYGWRVTRGAVPYLDLWDNKPPGIWWLNALAASTGASGPAADMLVGGAGLAAIAFGLMALLGHAHPVVGPPLAALATALVLANPRFEVGANRTETWVAALESLALWRLALACRREGAWRWFLAGLLAGCAPWVKQTGLGAVAAVLAAATLRGAQGHAPMSRRARWAALLLGALTPTLVGAGLLATQGAATEAFHATLTFNSAYYVEPTGAGQGWRLSVATEPLQPIRGMLAIAALWALVAAARSVNRAWGAKRPGAPDAGDGAPDAAGAPLDRRVVLAIWVWLLVALGATFAALGAQAYHFGIVLPALIAATMAPLAGALGRGAAVRPSMALLVALSGLALAEPAFDSAAAAERAWARKLAPGSWAWRETPDGMDQAEAIRAWSVSGDTLYVWGWSPGAYRYAQRDCPTRYATLEKVGQLGERATFILDRAVADLLARPPMIFVISLHDLRGLSAPPLEKFAAWIESSYIDRGVVRGMHILQRRR